jgi:hypothetical protein
LVATRILKEENKVEEIVKKYTDNEIIVVKIKWW